MTAQRRIVVNQSADLKDSLNDWIYDEAKGIVQSGPFAGMKLSREENWRDGNLGCKVLGCYEQELHQVVEREIDRLGKLETDPKIVDVGCAEGYYAVGMVRRLPRACMVPIDSDEKTLELAWQAARTNEVAHRFFKSDSVAACFMGVDLVICDCEGAEVDYIDKSKFPDLSRASIIVECHDYEQGRITNLLVMRFQDTHEVYGIAEGARNPYEFPLLRPLHSHARWLAVSEGRPFAMHWLYMVPKA